MMLGGDPRLAIEVTTALTRQLGFGDCVFPWFGHIDHLIHIGVFIAPLVTGVFFVTAEVCDRYAYDRRLKYYLKKSVALLIRFSAVSILLGVVAFLFISLLAPDALAACSRYG